MHADNEARAKSGEAQVAPFVQKLSNLLDDPNNRHLIRWSEEGVSVIVCDKHEFAEILLPELFKHKNFASFVRQLNSYGFSKRVSLTDNSMRAKERKLAGLSEFSHPHFRRGKRNLLSLIGKKNDGSRKKPRVTAADDSITSESDPDQRKTRCQEVDISIQRNGTDSTCTVGLPNEVKDAVVIRNTLHDIRETQKLSAEAINRLQKSNNDLQDQNVIFQRLHDQHLNSINAILRCIYVILSSSDGHGDRTDVNGNKSSQLLADMRQPTCNRSLDAVAADMATGGDDMSLSGNASHRSSLQVQYHGVISPNMTSLS